MIDAKDPFWGERLPEKEFIHPSEIYGKTPLEEDYANFEPNYLDPEFADMDPRKLKPDYLDLELDPYTPSELGLKFVERDIEPLEEEMEFEDESRISTIHEELSEHMRNITYLENRVDELENDKKKDRFRQSKIVIEYQKLQRIVIEQQKQLHDISKYRRNLEWLKRNHDDVVSGKSS